MSFSRNEGGQGLFCSIREYILHNEIAKIELAIKNGADVNAAVSGDGSTALHFSAKVLAESYCITVAKVYLAHGANPNMQNNAGESSVHTAASMGYCQYLNLLLVNGGDPLLGDLKGRSSVDFAFLNNHTQAYHILNDLLDSENYKSPAGQIPNVVLSFLKEEVVEIDVPEIQNPSSQEFTCNSAVHLLNKKDGVKSGVSEWKILNISGDQYLQHSSEESNASFNQAKPGTSPPNRNKEKYLKCLGQDFRCNTDSDSDNDLLALQKCLRKNLHIRSNSSQGNGFMDEDHFDSTLEFSYEKFNIAQLPIDFTLDDTDTSFADAERSYISLCNNNFPYNLCNKKVQSSSSSRDKQNGTHTNGCNGIISDDQQIRKQIIDNSSEECSFHSFQSIDTEMFPETYKEISTCQVDVNSTAPLNLTKPDSCTSFQLLKAPKKKRAFDGKFYEKFHNHADMTDLLFDSQELSLNSSKHLELSSCSYLLDLGNLYKNDSGIDAVDANATAPQNTTRPECCTSFHLLKAPKKRSPIKGHTVNNDHTILKESSYLSRPKESCKSVNENFPPKIGSARNLYESSAEYGTGKSCGSKGSTLVSVVKEFLYEDLQEGISLIERRCPTSASINSLLTTRSASLSTKVLTSERALLIQSEDVPDSAKTDQSFDSVGTLTESVKGLKGEHLQKSLKDIGFDAGPILPSTERVYQRHLMRLRKNPDLLLQESQKEFAIYSRELKSAMEDPLSIDFCACATLERTMSSLFSQPDPHRHWRDGTNKMCFNYLLLDPRITRDLPVRGVMMEEAERYKCFVSAVFYVGKGTRCRPYYHLYEAYKSKKNESRESDKAKRIQEIWSEGVGVVSLHVFQNTIPVEAWTREASIISAIGLENICNRIKGTFYGVASTWKGSEQRVLGTHLLRRSLNIFMQEGERQLRPSDVTVPIWFKK